MTPLDRLRALALALPEAHEVEAWGEATVRPPYVGPSGWIGVWLDRRPSWKDVAELLRDGWSLVAPKRLLP